MFLQRLLHLSCFLLFFSASLFSQCWNLVWEDEFNGTSLDLSNWEYQVGGGGWGNSELQYYTDGDNVTVSNGSLKITAEEDSANQYPNNAYTSSRIRTRYQGDWRYGKMEASIKLPIGQGIWPAFWMMPSESVYGTWPASGEIDIMEYLGHQPSTTYATCHYGNAWNDKGSSGSSTNISPSIFNDDFHTFSIEWEPTQIRWYLDGTQFHETNDTDPDFSTYNWPFDQEFHFILNVAVGGQWPGSPDASTVFPQTMEVDWVRTYQLLPDVELVGPEIVESTSTGTIYSLPNIVGASYNWSVPTSATIVSGQNTNQITVDWGSTSGTISADMTTSCGTENYSIAVEVSPNLWLNYNFENGMSYWNNNQANGATANFDLVSTEVQEGTTSACVTTLTLAANRWDIQLGRSLELLANEEYTLIFWAKADAAGKDIDIAFINASTYAWYAGTNIPLTDTWMEYSYTFTAPASANSLFNIDLGDELGTFCFDDFLFARTSVLNACDQPLSTPTSRVISGNVVELDWDAVAEADKYKVRYRPVGGTWTEVNAPVNNRFLNGLTPLTTYEYGIKTVCEFASSTWTSTETFTTFDDVCDYPNSSVSINDATTATLSWAGFANVTKYKIKYKAKVVGAVWTEEIFTGTSKILSGLMSGTNYKYKLKTKCTNGWTNWSPKVDFSMPSSRYMIQNEAIRVFPNPTTEHLNIALNINNSQKVAFSIYNSLGTLMQTYITFGQLTTINTQDLPSGVYFLHIKMENKKWVKSFIKQ